jgi:N-acetylglucosamine malate deacetylase 1
MPVSDLGPLTSDLVFGTPGPVDVLVTAAHPDDAELCIGGTICKLVRQGHRVAVVDFTRGELGTRGTPETRLAESAEAARILGLSARENLGLPDGDLAGTDAQRRAVASAIRRYRPHVLLINAPDCRHPDHPAAARLAAEANFYAGLARIETGKAPHRAAHVLHYMQSVEFEPTLVVDVSGTWAQRMEAFFAFRSQFGAATRTDADETGPQTFISNPAFVQWIEARARSFGYRVGATYGEPLLYRHGPFGTDDLMAVLAKDRAFK